MADLRGRSRGDLLPHAEVPHLRAPAPPGQALNLAGLQPSGRARLIRRVLLPGTWPFPGGWVGEVKACCAVKGFTGAGARRVTNRQEGTCRAGIPGRHQFRAACLMMRYNAAATPFGWRSRRRGSGRSAPAAGLRGKQPGAARPPGLRPGPCGCPPLRAGRRLAVPAEPHLPAITAEPATSQGMPRMTEGGGRVRQAGDRLAIPRDGPLTLRPPARPIALAQPGIAQRLCSARVVDVEMRRHTRENPGGHRRSPPRCPPGRTHARDAGGPVRAWPCQRAPARCPRRHPHPRTPGYPRWPRPGRGAARLEQP
jgi:hypothetical protein